MTRSHAFTSVLMPVVSPEDRVLSRPPGGGSIAEPNAGTWSVSGQARQLPSSLLDRMQARLGINLGQVRISEDTKVARMGARAYAMNGELRFAPGQYAPASSEGRKILAHELAHLVQQRHGRVRATGMVDGIPTNSQPSLEREADVLGNQALNAPPVPSGIAVPKTVASMLVGSSQPAAQFSWEIQPGGKTAWWTSRRRPDSGPPEGTFEVPFNPPGLPDLARRGGGNMRTLRTRPNRLSDYKDKLHNRKQRQRLKLGMYYKGRLDRVSMGPVRVRAQTRNRINNAHVKPFRDSINKKKLSATQYREETGGRLPGMKYNIGHAVGHSLGGRATNNKMNLGAISEGTNSLMIPHEHNLQGDPDIILHAEHLVRPGTRLVEQVRWHPYDMVTGERLRPIRFDAHMAKPSRAEWDEQQAQAEMMYGTSETRDTARSLVLLNQGFGLKDYRPPVHPKVGPGEPGLEEQGFAYSGPTHNVE